MSIPSPILRFTDGSKVVDILEDWQIADPYWRPQIPQYKRGGSYVNSGVAEGQRLVHKEYDNVIETIPLAARGIDQDKCIKTIRELLQLGRQAADYWSEIYEFDDVWLECKPPCNDCFTGYARVVKLALPDLAYPFGQPFFSVLDEAVMDGLTLTVEREPLWRGVPPGEMIGPLYNLIRNPDFELWNFGIADSQPDSWSDLETIQITGDNGRQTTAVHSGENALRVHVGGSTLAGRIKGVTQTISPVKDNTEYTVIAWVRNDGVSNGVGRVLVTYSSQLEVYRSATAHGWTLYTGKFTTGTGDIVAINCEILTTAAGTDGTVYFDSLMLLEGNWEQEAIDGVLPYMSSSHIVNHWDQAAAGVVEAGDINWVDMWDVPGDESAPVQLQVVNNNGDGGASYAVLRVGMRRAGDITMFDNYHDPPGVIDTTASGNTYLDLTSIGTAWTPVTLETIVGNSEVRNNQGRYRLLARVWDENGTPTLQVRASYFIGTALVNQKILNAATIPIAGDWAIINLTPIAALNFDTKFFNTAPTGLGYLVEMRRGSGSAAARFDYGLMLPTDGGYGEIELSPPAAPGDAVVITEGEAVGSLQEKGFSLSYNAAFTPQISSLASFQGSLFAGQRVAGGLVRLYRLRQGSWSQTASTSGDDIRAMAEYNGLLYIAVDVSPQPSRLYRTTDGVGLELAANVPQTDIFAMVTFNNYLYLGTSGSKIYRWDNSSLTEVHTAPGNVTCLAVYQERLFAGNAGGTVEVYDPVSDTWSTSMAVQVPDIDAVSLEVFEGRLYMAGNQVVVPVRVIVREFDGQTWADNNIFLTDMDIATALQAYNDHLFLGGENSVGVETQLYSFDGTTWALFEVGANFIPASMEVYDGALFIGGQEASATTGQIYTLADITRTYKVGNFQLSSFRAPSRDKGDPRRHRYIFSYDRANNVNNADDAALVGIGIVPRYLSLRGHG